MVAKSVKGISLPRREVQQVISQYANNSFLTILAKKDLVLIIVQVLEDFKLTLGLEINWKKNTTFWCSANLSRLE